MRLTQALKTAKAVSERRCVATGAALTPEEGLRFVLSPDGELAPDFSGKLPGRGAWLTPDRALLEAALKKGAFARSFKAGVKAPADLAARIEAGLAKQALSALGLARRAGDAVTGFEKVRAALGGGSAAVLVNAADGGEDGRRKLAGLAGDAAAVDLRIPFKVLGVTMVGEVVPAIVVAGIEHEEAEDPANRVVQPA